MLAEFEAGDGRRSDQPIEAYLAQLSSIQHARHDLTASAEVAVPDARARGRGGHPDPRLAVAHAARVDPRIRRGRRRRAATPACGSRRSRSTTRCCAFWRRSERAGEEPARRTRHQRQLGRDELRRTDVTGQVWAVNGGMEM